MTMAMTILTSSIQIFPLLTIIIKAIFSILFLLAQGSCQASNALQCYSCLHTESTYPPGTASDLKCVDPVKGRASNATCPNSNESCIIAVGEGKLGIYGAMKIWVRQCYSVQKGYSQDPEGCRDLYMQYNLNDSSIRLPVNLRSFGGDGENLKVAADLLPQKDVLNKSSSADADGSGSGTGAFGSGSGTGTGKQLGIVEVDLYGTYCICHNKNLCNKYDDAELEDTATKKGSKNTTTPLTEGTAFVNEAAPYVIFVLCTFTTAS